MVPQPQALQWEGELNGDNGAGGFCDSLYSMLSDENKPPLKKKRARARERERDRETEREREEASELSAAVHRPADQKLLGPFPFDLQI